MVGHYDGANKSIRFTSKSNALLGKRLGQLCYKGEHFVTDCNKCKRLSTAAGQVRPIDYMRRVHCSDAARRQRGAGQRRLMVVLSQRQQFTLTQFTIHGQCWSIPFSQLLFILRGSKADDTSFPR